jgi:hypothetical protein
MRQFLSLRNHAFPKMRDIDPKIDGKKLVLDSEV